MGEHRPGCKAGEVSVAFELDEERAASPHLAIAPCTFAADKGAKLEVEVVAPDAPQAAALAAADHLHHSAAKHLSLEQSHHSALPAQGGCIAVALVLQAAEGSGP